ncbi:resuscitation-promoting factor [Paeniglutamicibacter sp. Y32M11]|uniref:resuscitation-promoting factor n=1 Tax=Paeniglutamicibacter sp. Y32M11 TaxID=2853258 RepID=UPI00272A37B1|nr:resuscitation-promoting factor [Paeniglutamicibacter sp. Y32M11]
MKIGAQAAVLTALILGLVMFVGSGKTIAVAIDGENQNVSTRAATVADVLKDSSITLDERDEVSPALDAPVADGALIDIKRHKEVNVNIDGVDRVVHTTGLTVADVIDQLNLSKSAQVDQGAALALASLSNPIDISTPKDVSIKVDGKTKTLNTTVETVAEALSEAKITVGKKDELNAKATDAIVDGLKLKIVRVSTKTITETKTIKNETDTVKDSDALVGTEKTITEGKDGERTLTYTVTLRDGKETKRKLDSDKVTTKPVDEKVSIGTKAKPKPKVEAKTESNSGSESKSEPKKTSTPGSVSASWAALAKCESGGNWSINTGNGYYGGLQFSASSWLGAGGGKYAPLPHLASPSEQVATAEKLRANGGWGHWPHCSSKLGLR